MKRRTKSCEKARGDVEKQDTAFSKSVVEIKSRKIKNRFLMFAKLSVEKGNETACKALKRKIKRREQRNGT
jgi:hypothetical protein